MTCFIHVGEERCVSLVDSHQFEIHRRNCIVFLCMTLYPLLNTGSTQEDRKRPDMTEKVLAMT